MARLESRPTFAAEDGRVLQFVPIKNVPGFSHRVTINGLAADYLGDNAKPSAKSAEFFLGKHSTQLSPA